MYLIGSKSKSNAKQLCKELKQYQRAGVRLLLDGNPSTPKEIAHVCTVREDQCYMRDYIRDDSDGIWGISFDFVKDLI